MTAKVLAMLPKGAPRTRWPSLNLNIYPTYRPGRSWLYAVGFDGGITKIGRSRAPRQRLKTHLSSSGGAMLWCHLFQSIDERFVIEAERRALALAAKVGSRINDSEWFRGLSRDEAIKACRQGLTEAQSRLDSYLEQARVARERAKAEATAKAEKKAARAARKAAL